MAETVGGEKEGMTEVERRKKAEREREIGQYIAVPTWDEIR